jgi:tRNA(His) 5'-end guanylyltransferase
MQDTMKYLCENIQGCVLGYTQSDEITLVLVDYAKLETSAWFDYEVQKMVSVSAALATYAFNKYFNEFYLEQLADKGEADKYDLVYDEARRKGAYFDSRVFNIPKEEVTNCVLWRQLDAERNSINSLAQSLFSHKSLQGLNIKDTKAKIEAEKGIIWGNLPTTQKRGSCCVKVYNKVVGGSYNSVEGYKDFTLPETDAVKGEWIIDNNIPRFIDEGRNYVEKLVFIGE